MDSKMPKSSTNAEAIQRVRDRMRVYLENPPEKRAEEVRKLGRGETK